MSVVLPELAWKPSGGYAPRHGSPVVRVVIHRWSVRVAPETTEQLTFNGVVGYLRNPANRASTHVVYDGDSSAAQLVRWTDYAWTEAAYNPSSVEVEADDNIWVAGPQTNGTTGYNEHGLEVLARITAFLLTTGGGLHTPAAKILPPVWSHDRGFCRHGDLGAAGGSHPDCPTTDLARWRHFCTRVQYHWHLGGFRTVWGI